MSDLSITSSIRPPELRRSWMFVPGMNAAIQQRAIGSGADVVVVDLEEFTAKNDRPAARKNIIQLMEDCRAQHVVGAVRINKMEEDGYDDLAGIMSGQPAVIFIPHAETAQQIAVLDKAISEFEVTYGIAPGSTEITPTIESATGMLALREILNASPRVKSCLLAAEDYTDSLGGVRGPDGIELQYAKSRFLLECVAAKCVAIDPPCTFYSHETLSQDLATSRRLGYVGKCVVFTDHLPMVHAVFTPSEEQVKDALALITAFEHQKTNPPTEISLWIDAPKYNNAKRLIARHAKFDAYAKNFRRVAV